MKPLVFVALLLFIVPLAEARTLQDFEEPYQGSDLSGAVVPFTVTDEEAGEARALIYRNDPRSVFNLSVVDADGSTVFSKRGTRGIQTLPGLSAGEYRFQIQGTGEFQLTTRALHQLGDVESALEGTHAYVFVAPEWTNVTITGANVTIESWVLTEEPQTMALNSTRLFAKSALVVFTLRGSEDASYAITMQEAAAPPAEAPDEGDARTPGLALPILVVALALVARLRCR